MSISNNSAVYREDITLHCKKCTKCNVIKPFSEFSANKSRSDGKRSECKACFLDYLRRRRKDPNSTKRITSPLEIRKKNRSVMERRSRIKRTYGITEEEYLAKLAAQGGVCAICGKAETALSRNGHTAPLSIDHDHKTGEIRELLCRNCNSQVAALENWPYFEAGLAYIIKHSS